MPISRLHLRRAFRVFRLSITSSIFLLIQIFVRRMQVIGISSTKLFQIMLHGFDIDDTPNKSPEPTAVGAVRSAIAVHAASRRWLSFFR